MEDSEGCDELLMSGVGARGEVMESVSSIGHCHTVFSYRVFVAPTFQNCIFFPKPPVEFSTSLMICPAQDVVEISVSGL